MARVWPRAASCSQYFLQEESVHVNLPPIEEQERLLNLYFTYVHPVFPVVHKSHFLAQFNARYACLTYCLYCQMLSQLLFCSKNWSVLTSQVGMNALTFAYPQPANGREPR
jgi:hypothetical protein